MSSEPLGNSMRQTQYDQRKEDESGATAKVNAKLEAANKAQSQGSSSIGDSDWAKSVRASQADGESGFLGKRMRALSDEDIAAIKKQLEVIEGPGRVETAKLHRLERLRERLLQSDEALQELITKYPALDIQSIRTLIRNAKKEREANKPPKAYREIFQYLRELET
ncbi:MAG: DUF615 domain-containing protein [Burkholderiaceae bacterium]|nr:DUF615 domain-containing protein [Burkholderiaceae bacterium]